MTIKLVMAFVLALLIATAFGALLVPYLRRIRAGQTIREDGPTWHMSKAGTPTMGGLMFIVAEIAVCLTVGFDDMLNGEYGHIFVLAFSMIYGAIGFLDDAEKLRRKQNLGLRGKTKFLLQLVVALAFIFLLRYFGYITPNIYVPFFNVALPVSEPVFIVLAAFIMVGTVNAVNLTDGVDGLVTGVSVPVFVFFVAAACLWGAEFQSLGIFAAGMTGGLLGFLFFNYNPAKVFMGDTGSLFLGGAVCAMAFAYDMPLILVTLGIIYIIETLSDIIQVAYFKLSHGKRVFRMAPFHHHLEMGGWSGKKWTEREIFALFTTVSAAFAVLSFVGVYWRYGF